MTDFENSLRNKLRSEERDLDLSVESRLRQARLTACGQASYRRAHLWLPVTGMALASVAFFALMFTPLSPFTDGANRNQVFLENVQAQELDFYYWLAETENGKGS